MARKTRKAAQGGAQPRIPTGAAVQPPIPTGAAVQPPIPTGAAVQSQLRDAKGVNVERDGRRRKGGADVVALTKGKGTGKFRKSHRAPD